MSLVRMVAVAALILTAALAVALPIFGDSADGGQWILLLLAAANAALVAVVSRTRPFGVARAGLWLILVGVAGMLISATSPYWVEGLLPRGDSVEDILARFDSALSAFLVPFWIGSLALILGWILWIASRIAARRRARVA